MGVLMKKSRIRLGFVALVASVVLVGGVATPSYADSGQISPDVLAFINTNFDELGVAQEVRAGLLKKYAAGESFDNASGAQPVSVESYRVDITDYTREVFADGSVTLTSLERPTTPTKSSKGLTPYGIVGCSYKLSGGVATWSNCKIEKNNIILTMWYHAGYWRYSGGGYGTSITNTWDWDIQTAGGACAFNYLGNPTSTKSRLRAYCTVVLGIGSSYPYLDLDITSSTVAVNANW
ncbi:MAG: hypothetical protein KDB18_01595 [Salinibacterium sp.]|jgi:hypothetical protein|nr:hypothetical protein [Salinibacterium sp.]